MVSRWAIYALIIAVTLVTLATALMTRLERLTGEHRIYRIGIVVRGASYAPGVEGFRARMAALGYTEGEDVTYDVRFVDSREDLPGAFAELIRAGVDLLHVYSTPATIEAYTQTKTIPIVFGSMGDPLASKTVQSLESSGTNVTGVNSLSVNLAAKRLEYLLEAVPGITRVAMVFSPDDIPGNNSFVVAREAARKLGVEISPYPITKERPLRQTIAAVSRTDVDAMVLSSDSATWASLDELVEVAYKERLPFAVFDKDMVVQGGLIGYGPDYFVSGEQSAVLADKILQGQRPADLPIEVPHKLLLAVNLVTARRIGVAITPSILERADLIIDQ
ncbi:MAG: ABC transporter substrate-binding protein [bacterium]|nr:ABC transporter substrate-binding protein [bacterium]MDZ4296577.1 ABC transporter substrate-binding protein [Patescibacteria group bacterium]